MRKFTTILILIITVLNIRLYPYIAANLKSPDKYRPITYINKVLTSPSLKTQHNFPQTMAVGTVAIGETIAGFTLAEVLITLLIIGIVASLIIPNLIQDTQDVELKVAWKKEFGVLSQATRRILAENGGSFKGIASTYDTNVLRDLYLQYISTVKKCNHGQWAGKCWHSHNTSAETGIGITKFLNGTNVYMNIVPLGGGTAAAVTSDGSFLIFAYSDNTCNSGDVLFHHGCDINTDEGINRCGWMTVDVNGKKGPNVVGKDIFGVWIVENGIVPFGVKDLSDTCNSSSTGLGCSALYLSQ